MLKTSGELRGDITALLIFSFIHETWNASLPVYHRHFPRRISASASNSKCCCWRLQTWRWATVDRATTNDNRPNYRKCVAVHKQQRCGKRQANPSQSHDQNQSVPRPRQDQGFERLGPSGDINRGRASPTMHDTLQCFPHWNNKSPCWWSRLLMRVIKCFITSFRVPCINPNPKFIRFLVQFLVKHH